MSRHNIGRQDNPSLLGIVWNWSEKKNQFFSQLQCRVKYLNDFTQISLCLPPPLCWTCNGTLRYLTHVITKLLPSLVCDVITEFPLVVYKTKKSNLKFNYFTTGFKSQNLSWFEVTNAKKLFWNLLDLRRVTIPSALPSWLAACLAWPLVVVSSSEKTVTILVSNAWIF